MTQFQLPSYVKYGFHCPIFTQTARGHSMEFPYQVSLKLVQKMDNTGRSSCAPGRGVWLSISLFSRNSSLFVSLLSRTPIRSLTKIRPEPVFNF